MKRSALWGLFLGLAILSAASPSASAKIFDHLGNILHRQPAQAVPQTAAMSAPAPVPYLIANPAHQANIYGAQVPTYRWGWFGAQSTKKDLTIRNGYYRKSREWVFK